MCVVLKRCEYESVAMNYEQRCKVVSAMQTRLLNGGDLCRRTLRCSTLSTHSLGI